MGGRGQEYCLLTVHLLQSQISGEQVPIRDLSLLEQFLHGVFRGSRRICALRFLRIFKADDEPVGFGKPLDSREPPARAIIELRIDPLLSALDLIRDYL